MPYEKKGGTHTYSLDSEPAHPAHHHKASLDTLQQDMLGALEYDQKKKQVNDAKLRAVAQRVEYDDFERLVMGAHLKPLKPKSDDLAAVGRPFDGFVMPKLEPSAPSTTQVPLVATAGMDATTTPPAPKSSNEFVRTWRRQCKTTAQRHAYIRQIVPETWPMLFRTELDAAIFDGVVATCGEVLLARADGATDAPSAATARDDELPWTAALLQSIARINRFDLTLDFADKATMNTLAALFDVLQGDPTAAGQDAQTLAALRAAYTV